MLARDLRRRGYRVEACADRPNSALRHSRHISAFHVVPPISEPGALAQSIGRLVRSRHIGMFLPSTDQVFALAPYREQLAAEAHYMFEDAPTLDRVHNKLSLQTALRASGLRTPYAVPWDLGPLPPTMHYPVVVKDVAGAGATGYRLVHDDAGLASARAARRASRVPALLQQFVAGRQLLWMGVLHEGRLAASLPVERELLVPAEAGPSVLRRSLRLPELDRLGERLLTAIPYRGFASIDVIEDRDGRFWFLDFNPRLCAAFHTSLRAGVSFADILYRLAHGGAPSAPSAPNPRAGAYSLSLCRLAQRFMQSPSAWRSSLAALRHIAAAEEFYPRDALPLAAALCNRVRLKFTAVASPGAGPPMYPVGTHGIDRPEPRPHL